jgi:hypothetical protein
MQASTADRKISRIWLLVLASSVDKMPAVPPGPLSIIDSDLVYMESDLASTESDLVATMVTLAEVEGSHLQTGSKFINSERDAMQ